MRGTPRGRAPSTRKRFCHDADLDGFVVTLERRFDGHQAAALEDALTEPERRGQWLPPPVHSTPPVPGTPEPCTAVGADWAYRFPLGDDTVRLRFEDGSLVVDQVFGGAQPWCEGLAAGRCAAGWETSFGRLATLLGGGSPRPARLAVARAMTNTRWFEQHSGTPQLTIDGNLLRFDRDLLGLAPGALWSLLSRDDGPAEEAMSCGLNADVVTELAGGEVLEFDVRHGIRPAGSVRWELHDDPGYGGWVRMDHLVAEDSTSELYMLLASWQLAIEALLRRAHGLSLGTLAPDDEYTIELLAERYLETYPNLFPDF